MIKVLAMNELTLEEELNIKRYKNQRVIVRVWASGGNQLKKGEGVGHISLETPMLYMSLWPKETPSGKGAGLFKSVPHETLPSYKVDLNYEEREPEFVFCFYSLNTIAMDNTFLQLKQTLTGWDILGKCKDSESCASLAYRLLQTGGLGLLFGNEIKQSSIQTSIHSNESSKGGSASIAYGSQATSFVLGSQANKARDAFHQGMKASFYSVEMGAGEIIHSPDSLAAELKEAKKEELKKHPLTKHIEKIEGETIVRDEAPSKTVGMCIVM